MIDERYKGGLTHNADGTINYHEIHLPNEHTPTLPELQLQVLQVLLQQVTRGNTTPDIEQVAGTIGVVNPEIDTDEVSYSVFPSVIQTVPLTQEEEAFLYMSQSEQIDFLANELRAALDILPNIKALRVRLILDEISAGAVETDQGYIRIPQGHLRDTLLQYVTTKLS